ncbi:MAG: ferritin [Marinisporobacter sp.]|jgi:ferritin|nr:ferritin [Marinisporobacter sp.]
MISEKLMQSLNEQINYEFYSSNIYLAMAAFCASEDLDGFANFFKMQAEEEKFHAMKFFDYVVEMGGRVTISALDEPQNDYTSMLDVFMKGLEHEKLVTQRIYKLTDLAMEEREHATMSFLKWFIDEQVEEESTFNSIIKKLERISDNSNALYMLDAELAQRTFTPPAQ